MKGFIDGVDWLNIEPMKYWSFTAGTSDEVKKQTVRNAIFGGNYLGALKVDGFYQRLLKDEDGNCFMIARSRNVNGEVVDKYQWVPQIHEWMNNLPNGTCVLAEAYLPGNEGSKNVTSILGCLKEKAIDRQKKTPLHFHIFDCMAFNGKSLHNTCYEDRTKFIWLLNKEYNTCTYVHYAEFYEGAELWSKLQEYLAEGREGMVIMRKDAIVYTKRTPARVSIKVKKELRQTIDCFFTGRGSAPSKEYTGKEIETWTYWENQRTGELLNQELYKEYCTGASIVPVTKSYFNHWYGSLEIAVLDNNGNTVSIGWLSGLPEQMRARPKDYAFKPIEVTAMEWDPIARTLRHGKMLGWRQDLTIQDCTLDKIEG